MRESFNDNTSDYMYKHIKLDLLSFSLSSPRWHRMHISFCPETFLRSKIHIKITSTNSVEPLELSVFNEVKSRKTSFRQKPGAQKVWLTQHNDLKERQSSVPCLSLIGKFSLPRRLINCARLFNTFRRTRHLKEIERLNA